jgi:C-terminal processing protease CtpA/Prc
MNEKQLIPDVKYEMIHVRLRKNVRGFGLSITGGYNHKQQPHTGVIGSPAADYQCFGKKQKQSDDSPAAGQQHSGGTGSSIMETLSQLIRIRACFPAEPADEAGLRAGDFLIQVNDVSLVHMTSGVSCHFDPVLVLLLLLHLHHESGLCSMRRSGI